MARLLGACFLALHVTQVPQDPCTLSNTARMHARCHQKCTGTASAKQNAYHSTMGTHLPHSNTQGDDYAHLIISPTQATEGTTYNDSPDVHTTPRRHAYNSRIILSSSSCKKLTQP